MGNPDNSNHAELTLPATPWEMVDAMDRLRLSEGQEPYWQVEDMGRYEFLAPHLDGYDLYQFNALAEKLRTFSDVDAVVFEGLVQMELDKLWQNNGGELTLRRVLDLAYSVDCCHVVPGITDDAALGQFYVENDFLPDLASVPDSRCKHRGKAWTCPCSKIQQQWGRFPKRDGDPSFASFSVNGHRKGVQE